MIANQDDYSSERIVQFSNHIVIMNDTLDMDTNNMNCNSNTNDINPILALLDFDDDEMKLFMRISLTKVNQISPGLYTKLNINYINKWELIINEFQNGNIEEDFHELLIELWPFIHPRNHNKQWNIQQFIDMLLDN